MHTKCHVCMGKHVDESVVLSTSLSEMKVYIYFAVM